MLLGVALCPPRGSGNRRELTQEEEVEMATYIQDVAEAVMAWKDAELERLQTS